MKTADLTQDAGTEDLPSRKHSPNQGLKPERLALVIAWSRDEPWRVGEVMLLGGRGVGVLGRGDQPVSHGYRVQLIRQMPGVNQPRAALGGRRISREQLRIATMRGGKLMVENTGRCPMWVHRQPVAQAVVEAGDIIELEGQLLLYVTPRPDLLPGEAPRAPQALGDPDDSGIVGETPAAWALRQVIDFVAPRPGHVLILGESGAGKELVARAVHRLSQRADRAMVSRNAATLPHSLVDAELFGHARNYPNAGMPERVGLVGEAEGSTLFLDEIGELPKALQAHLLRLMDRGEYQRLGEGRSRTADLRFIGATNRAADELKADFGARFRHVITAPSLNARREDIPLLVRHLLCRAAADDQTLVERFFDEDEQGRLSPRVHIDLMAALLRHPLPLQVRQLDNLLWRSLAVSHGDRVVADAALLEQGAPSPSDEPAATSPEDLTPEEIQACLDKHKGVQARVWRELGLQNRYVLRRLIRKYDLQVMES